ncbi:MAG TPA: hypothetical protein VEV41_12950 [Terriglobales bacterium]|nr:hypothetical protein [Terriglobales bacterium]
MRFMKLASLLAIFLLTVGMAMARQNKFGVADIQQIAFGEPVKVGDGVLPKGEYKIEHVMEGENHIMVFSQLHSSSPATARVKCQLVPLKTKAPSTQILYTRNDANEHVLEELVFAGDTAKHVF